MNLTHFTHLARSAKTVIDYALFFVCLSLFSFNSQSSATVPPIVPANLSQVTEDFSQWELKDAPIRKIRGNWLFYWKQLISPEDFLRFDQNALSAPLDAITVPMPKYWNDIVIPVDSQLEQPEGYGWATYRKKIILPTNINDLSLTVPAMVTAYQLWVNGELLVKQGQVGTTPSTSHYSPNGYKVVKVDIPLDSPILDVVVQISNFDYRVGGTWRAITIGSTNAINHLNTRNILIDGAITSALLIMAFYHFGLYFMRRKNPAPAYFALGCLAIVARSATSGNGNIANFMFGDFDGQLARQLEYLGLFIAGPMMYCFFQSLFPSEFSKRYAQTYLAIILILSFIVIVAPMRVFTEILFIPQILFLPTMILTLFSLFLAVKRQRESSIIVSFGAVIIIFGGFNDLLFAIGKPIINFYILHITLLMLAIFQALALAQRFTTAFTQVESSEKAIQILNADLKQHNEHLDQLVDERTREIKSILQAIQQGLLIIEGRDGEVGKTHSPHLEKILMTNKISGGNIYPLLFEQSSLSEDEKNQIMSVISASIDEADFCFDMNEHLLPRELSIDSEECQHKIIYELDWNPIIVDEIVKRILLVIRDVTDLRTLEEKSKQQMYEIEIILEIINVPEDKFYRVLASCHRCIEENRKIINENNQFNYDVVDKLFRNMHTMKGNARSHHLKLLSEAAYISEKLFKQSQDKGEWVADKMLSQMDKSEKIIDTYIEVNETKLGRSNKG